MPSSEGDGFKQFSKRESKVPLNNEIYLLNSLIAILDLVIALLTITFYN